jgi:hypothetical protein
MDFVLSFIKPSLSSGSAAGADELFEDLNRLALPRIFLIALSLILG